MFFFLLAGSLSASQEEDSIVTQSRLAPTLPALLCSSSASHVSALFSPLLPAVTVFLSFLVALHCQLCWHGDQLQLMQASPVLHCLSLDSWTPRSSALLGLSLLSQPSAPLLSVLSVTVPQNLDVNFSALPRCIHVVRRHKATSCTFLLSPLPHLQLPVSTVS